MKRIPNVLYILFTTLLVEALLLATASWLDNKREKKLDKMEGKVEYRFATLAEVEVKKCELENKLPGQEETGNIWKKLESFFPYIEEKTISSCRYRFYYLKKDSEKFVAVYLFMGQFQVFTSSTIYADRAVPLTDEYGWGTTIKYYDQELTICADIAGNLYVAVVPKE